ncbi:unnamed protein product, partial [Durusdinium trenchii]
KVKQRNDDGEYEQPLPKARRNIFISQKLKVADFYLRKKKENDEGQLPPKTNPERLCREEFPDLVGKVTPLKWVHAAAREKWRDIPSALASRLLITPTTWREKVGCARRARSHGSSVPHELQVELGHLIAEHCQGLSEVTERKEVVTPDQATTIQSLIEDWNSNLTSIADQVQEWNDEIRSKLQEKKISPGYRRLRFQANRSPDPFQALVFL